MDDTDVQAWSEGALRLLRKLDNFNEETSSKQACVPLVVGDQAVGILQTDLVETLRDYPEVFDFVSELGEVKQVGLNSKLSTYDQRSEALRRVVDDLKKRDIFETLRFWRNEDYDVSTGPSQPALFKLERAATSLFGVRAYGAHMNGYVSHPERGLCLWLGRRSPTKQTFPGMLDNLATGGIGVGLSVRETMIKECYEEASIPESIAKNLVPVGCVSYTYESSRGISMELQYCYDLELPLTFTPKPLDGEVQEFMLCDVDEVKGLIIQDEFKPNCAAITLHFLIRHGYIAPDNEPKYTEIIHKMNNWH